MVEEISCLEGDISMVDTLDMDKLFGELESDLNSLRVATARSLMELDAEGSAALSRWLENWSILEDFG